MILDIIIVIIGISVVLAGADRLTEGASALARRLHVSEIVIGLTIVAAGTSAPELFVSLVSALKGTPDLAVGNVVGSNIMNAMLIVGCAAMVAPMVISRSTVHKDIPFAVIASVLLVLACIDGQLSWTITGHTIGRLDGVMLQNGAAITFAVKIDAAVAEDGTVADVDLTRPLISFGSDEKDAAGNDISAHFYITANGQVVYNKPTQLQSLNLNENDPSSVKTGILSPNEWHFVALQLSTEGYQLYVDGKKSLSGYQTSSSATSFQYKTLVDSINSLPYIYIGGDSKLTAEETNTVSIDNVTLIRNMMEEKDWNKTIGGNAGGDETFKLVDYVNGESPTTEIGTSDCSADWWTSFSDYYRVPAGATLHLKFENHTSGAGNWNNWNLCVATDDARNVGNYAEHFVMRSDLFGWGGNASTYNAANISNEGYGDWNQFKADMEGAQVDITLERKGDEIYMTAVATAKNGTVYKEMYHQTIGQDVIRVFLIADHSYLKLDASGCTVSEPAKVETTEIGTSDCSADWWTSFSDYFQIPAGKTLNLAFENHTSGAGNWNNWNLCVATDDDRNVGNYAEHFVMRSDLFGWGGAASTYNAANITNEGYGDWEQFKADMEGAKVNIQLQRKGDEIYMTAVATAKNGTVYKEMYHQTIGTDMVRAFLIADHSYLKLDANNCYLASPVYE